MNFKLLFRILAYLIIVVHISATRATAYDDFFRAVERDDASAVTALLQRGFDPNTRDERGQVALYLALRSPSLAVAEALWAHPGLEIDAANAAGETPLMMAALRGRAEWARRLLARGAAVHRPGWAPVHYAASGPEGEPVLRLLLDAGAPVNARSPNGTTPLMMAARYGSEASVDLLLARGADATARNQLDLSAADFAQLDGREALAARLKRSAAPSTR